MDTNQTAQAQQKEKRKGFMTTARIIILLAVIIVGALAGVGICDAILSML